MEPSHLAFSDESYITDNRFRGIAVVSLLAASLDILNKEVSKLLAESGVSEFKWEKLKSAKLRMAAEKLVDCTISWILEGRCRVDVLVWDTQDSRHAVKGRNDLENMKRMYYHLFKNVMKERWGIGTTWSLYPDQHDALEWEKQKQFLKDGGLETFVHPPNLFNDDIVLEVRRLFGVEEMVPCKSELNPLIQLADLFAGLSVFSRASYDDYEKWDISNPEQPTLLGFFSEPSDGTKESNSERERFRLIRYFNSRCKHHKLGVSLKTDRGFKTMNPKYKLNIWLYRPQRKDDIAPTKTKIVEG